MTAGSHQTPTSAGTLIAEGLRAARERAGLSFDAAAAATSLPSDVLRSLEAGQRRPVPAELDRLSQAYGTDLSGLLPARRPLAVDASTGRIGIDGQTRRVRDLSQDDQVYAAYLSLLYAVRGAQPGEHVPLRSDDVDLLMSVLGEDAETIERRLVHLMGCNPAEARLLRGLLLRHRALTAAVGAAAALGLVALAAPGAGETSSSTADRTQVQVSEDVQARTGTAVSTSGTTTAASSIALAASTSPYGVEAQFAATDGQSARDLPITGGHEHGAASLAEPLVGGSDVEDPGSSPRPQVTPELRDPDPKPLLDGPGDGGPRPGAPVTGQPSTQTPVTPPAPGGGHEPVQESQPTPAAPDAPVGKDPAKAPEPATAPAPQLDPVTEARPQPVPADGETEPTPVSEPEPVAVHPGPAAEPVVQPEPQPESPPVVVEPKPEPVVVPLEPEPEPVAVEPQPKTKDKADKPKHEPKPDPVVDTTPDTEPAPEHPSSNGQGTPNKNH